jgi:hypothetical protein
MPSASLTGIAVTKSPGTAGIPTLGPVTLAVKIRLIAVMDQSMGGHHRRRRIPEDFEDTLRAVELDLRGWKEEYTGLEILTRLPTELKCLTLLLSLNLNQCFISKATYPRRRTSSQKSAHDREGPTRYGFSFVVPCARCSMQCIRQKKSKSKGQYPT